MWKFTKNKNKKWLQDFLFNFLCYIYIFCSFSKRFEKNSRIFTEKQKFPYLLLQKNKIVFTKNKKIGYKIFFLIFCVIYIYILFFFQKI